VKVKPYMRDGASCTRTPKDGSVSDCAGGAIDVHSILDQGSTFTIYLPRAPSALVTADEALDRALNSRQENP
jgi:hypothetical protein